MEECDFREEFSRQIEKAHTLKDKKNFLINSIKQISQDNVSGEVKSKLVREIDAIIMQTLTCHCSTLQKEQGKVQIIYPLFIKMSWEKISMKKLFITEWRRQRNWLQAEI